MIRKQFPTSYDVEQAITFHTTEQSALSVFVQSLGIITVGSKKDISDFVSGLLLGHEDFLQLRMITQGAEPSISISGFMLRHRLHDADIHTLSADLMDLRRTLHKARDAFPRRRAPRYVMGPPVRSEQNNRLKVHFEYERVIPGRVELMQHIDSEVDLLFEQKGLTQWQVVCYPSANQDVKTIQKLFNRDLARGQYDAYTISLERLTRKERIEFFDTLLDHYSSGQDWVFEQVTGISIKRPAQEVKSDELARTDDEQSIEIAGFYDPVEEVDSEYVESISQAVLEGRNLRTNKFVQDCEKRGFYFLSMTLHLANSRVPEAIHITIRYKLSPQMFEVILTKTMVCDEMGERDTVFPETRQQEILREFWDVSHQIWQRICEKAPRSERQQPSFADYMETAETNPTWGA